MDKSQYLRVLLVTAVFVTLSNASSVHAQSYCPPPPSKPACLSFPPDQFNNASYARCRDDVRKYIFDLETFRQCIDIYISNESKEVVDRLNCIARREKDICL